ncbi:hypothetical protein ACFPK1_20730 [Actinomycetospora rhizophila]|uniref:Uncharacterized protein n=1 Tax=Actinomycetospora rhizophila TaxID=1416876 RepID=A0ABV9ZH16_9PSEU
MTSGDGYLLDNRQAEAGSRLAALAELFDASSDDVDRHLENLRAGRLPDLATSPMVTAWGRRATEQRRDLPHVE